MLPGGGKIVEIRGLAGSTPARERADGFAEAIAGKNIAVFAAADGDWLREGQQQVDTCSSRNPDTQAIYAHNDPMAEGAYRAAKAEGRDQQLKFSGIDGPADPVRRHESRRSGQVLGDSRLPDRRQGSHRRGEGIAGGVQASAQVPDIGHHDDHERQRGRCIRQGQPEPTEGGHTRDWNRPALVTNAARFSVGGYQATGPGFEAITARYQASASACTGCPGIEVTVWPRPE